MIETQKSFLPAEMVRDFVRYDPKSGEFSWLPRPVTMFANGERWSAEVNCARWNTRFAGKPAFISEDVDGYLHGRIFRRSYCAHRVAFAHQTGRWPSNVIDHINGVPSDNRWCNLREATQQQNIWNTRPVKGGASKFRGVHLADGLWLAAIKLDGKTKRLGTFPTEKEAAEAYDRASVHYRGRFAYLNFPEASDTYRQQLESGVKLVKKRSSHSGQTGVRRLPAGNFQAYITIGRKRKHLGCFATLEEAASAYQRAKSEQGALL